MNGNISTHGARLKFPGTSVFTGAAPAAFTDLDLSSVTGDRECIVLLRIAKTAHTAAASYSVRTNGDTADYSAYGTGFGQITNNLKMTYILAVTDSMGIVEWDGTVNDAVAITLEAYAYE
jgi:hypothetical protein